MKVIHVVPAISAESAGPSYSVPALCRGLQKAGCDVTLCFNGESQYIGGGVEVRKFKAHRFPTLKLGRSPKMLEYLKEQCRTADIIHNNSVWMLPNIYPAWAKKGTKCKLVTQPRGTFSEWALSRSKWRKRMVGWLGQYSALRATDMWVATAESEYRDIRRLGFRQPVAILPNGVDLPVLDFGTSKEDNGRGNLRTKNVRRRMLYLSRIHPTKNVDILLRAWSKLEDEFKDWNLSIVGPDKNNTYADEMKVLAKLLCCERVTFEGELRGEAKYRFMSESDCEVLPTNSENFGMVVAESLACGTPVICSHGAPWAGLVREKCGWWVPTEEGAFEGAMREAMSMPKGKLAEMGLNGREWMRRDFDWYAIGCRMKSAYEWLVGKNAKPPDWVVLD